MAFRFNFFEEEDLNETISAKKNVQSLPKQVSPVLKSFFYEPFCESLQHLQWTELSIHGTGYSYLTDSSPNIYTDITPVSDLVPHVYEGGFEVWECTVDLLNFLHANNEMFNKSSSVLDLGCGAGLIGISAKRMSPVDSLVHFQDFNCDVIEHFTLKNYHRNCGDQKTHNVKFIAGDWSQMSGELHTYDFILSSETIYNCQSQQKVLNILMDHLAISGTAYFAAKRHYFGVGGGVIDFKELLFQSKCFNCENVWSNETGLLRDIIKITRIGFLS